MKISGRKGSEPKNVSFKGPAPVRGPEGAGGVESAKGGGGADAPSLAISERGKQIAEAKRALDALPDIRAEKVAPIQEALDQGTYDVPGEQVADKMVRDAVHELRHRRR